MEKSEEKSVLPSQGAAGASDSSSSFDDIVQNMAIAHEVAINADFKLNEVPSDSWVNTVLFHNGFDLHIF